MSTLTVIQNSYSHVGSYLEHTGGVLERTLNIIGACLFKDLKSMFKISSPYPQVLRNRFLALLVTLLLPMIKKLIKGTASRS
jgi:hypothetical protein